MKNKLSVFVPEHELGDDSPMEPMDPRDKYFVWACLVLGLIAILIGSCTGQP